MISLFSMKSKIGLREIKQRKSAQAATMQPVLIDKRASMLPVLCTGDSRNKKG